MPVKNLMEEIITSIVTEILSGEQDKISESSSLKDDVIAYVLNRIPPRYFTSERGIIEIGEKNHFFPHILGEVFEETTFSVIPDVEVTLTCNENPARMIDSSWNNPYITNTATKGYFHFWPDYNEALMDKLDRVPFKKFCWTRSYFSSV